MRVIILKNPQGVSDTWEGLTIPAGGQHTITTDSEREEFSISEKLNQDLWADPPKIVINDGENDLEPAEGDIWLKIGPQNKKTAFGVLKVAQVEADGDFLSMVSHNWSDKHSWYGESERVTGETLTLVGGTTYQLANDIVYLQGGRVMDEDVIYPNIPLVVYDNGVEVDPADYTVGVDLNQIIFDSAPTGPVTADYNKSVGSAYILQPGAGKSLILRKAEVQFSIDTVMTPLSFEIWAYNPLDLPNKVMVDQRIYKTERDLISIGNEGQGYIPKFGALQNDVIVFPFDYGRAIVLNDSQGVELRVRILDDTEFAGEWSSITFYTAEEDEPS